MGSNTSESNTEVVLSKQTDNMRPTSIKQDFQNAWLDLYPKAIHEHQDCRKYNS